MQWWSDKLIKPTHGLTPGELRDFLLHGTQQYMKASSVVTTCRIRRNFGQQFINVKIELYGDKPHVVDCWINIDLDFNAKQLTVQSVQVNDAGKGMGTALSSNIEGLARKLGYGAVSLFAAKAAGPYFWPRRGYIPTQDDWTASIAPEIRNWLDKLVVAAKIPADVKAEGGEILRDKDPQAITRIAALREPMIASSRNPETLIPLGRALLAESDITYNASLRL